MRVDTIRKTRRPEKLVCQYARGDYYSGYVPDVSYQELMSDASWRNVKEKHYRYIEESFVEVGTDYGEYLVQKGGNMMFEDKDTALLSLSLLENLIKKGHWGPFEHPQLNLYATDVSRPLMAQVTRHRHLTFDIQSQRYVDFSSKVNPTKVPATLREDQTKNEKLNREKGLTELEEDNKDELRDMGDELVDQSVALYEEMVDRGVPKEDARFYLPLGTTVNVGFSGNARALLHIMNMRMMTDAQWEARELSGMMLDELEKWMPWTHKVFEENGPFKLSP